MKFKTPLTPCLLTTSFLATHFLSGCGAASLSKTQSEAPPTLSHLECKANDGRGNTSTLSRTTAGWELAINDHTLKSATCLEDEEKIHCTYGTLFIDVLKKYAHMEQNRLVLPAVEGGYIFVPMGFSITCRQ